VNASSARRPRILVADDEEDIRNLIADILSLESFECDQVGNGVDAITKIFDGSYEAVILDLMMPIADGFEVLEELAETRPSAIRRVIAMTAGTNEIVQALDPRVFALLKKPFKPRELLTTVRCCVAQVKSGESTP
jgi:two-component system response regulator CpxR